MFYLIDVLSLYWGHRQALNFLFVMFYFSNVLHREGLMYNCL